MRSEIMKDVIKQGFETDIERNNYLECRVISLNDDIKSLIKTRRIYKRHKLDYTQIKELINLKESENIEYLAILNEQDEILDEMLVEIILKNYTYRKIDKDEQKELLDKIRNLYKRTYPNLKTNDKKGLSEWIKKLNLDNFYDYSESICLDFGLSYIKNEDNDWFDLYISIINWETQLEVDIKFENSRITEIKNYNAETAC